MSTQKSPPVYSLIDPLARAMGKARRKRAPSALAFESGSDRTADDVSAPEADRILLAELIERAPLEFLVFDAATSRMVFANELARRRLGLRHSGADRDVDERQNMSPNAAVRDVIYFPGEGANGARRNLTRTFVIGGRELTVQVGVELGEAQQTADLLAQLDHDVSLATNAEDYLRSAIIHLCQHHAFVAAHAYALAKDRGSLTVAGIWHFEPCSGVFLIGQKEPAPRPVERPADSLFAATAAPGARLAAAFSLFQGAEAVARIELFSAADGPPPNTPSLFEAVRVQIERHLERKRIEEDLALTRERFEVAVRGANIGLWEYNHRTRKFWFSDSSAAILGLTGDVSTPDLNGFLKLLHPEDVERTRIAFKHHLDERAAYDVEYRVRTSAGDYVWVHARGDGVWDADDVILRSVGKLEDITAKKEAEILRNEIMSVMADEEDIAVKIGDILERACRYLRMPIGLVSQIQDGRYEILNACGMPDDTPRGASLRLSDVICSDIFPSDAVRSFPDLDKSPLRAHPGRALMRAESYIGAPYFVNGRRFGTICFLSSSARSAPFSEAEESAVQLLATWIGQEMGRRAYITKLLENDVRMSAHLASVGDAALTLSAAGVIEEANPAAATLFGYEAADLKGRDVGDLAPSLRASKGDLSATPLRHDVAIHRDGRRIAILLQISEVRLFDRVVYAATLTDWTAAKQAETAKRDFVSTVSHELRTPLTSIRGALGLMSAGAAGPLGPAAVNLIRIAQKNSERLARLVNDILDIDRLESGRFELTIRPVHLETALSEAIAANAAYAAQYGVTYELSAPANLPPVAADADRFMQIITNLLSNAAKFTRPGTSIRIEVRSEHDQARILVHDKGEGVPASLRSSLFEKFARGDNSNRASARARASVSALRASWRD